MPSIEEYGGIDDYLNATKKIHGGWGAKRFRNAAEKRMPQEKMAEAMNVDRTTIINWESLAGISRYNKEPSKS